MYRKLIYSVVIISLLLYSASMFAAQVAPSEVISDVSIIKRKGKSAIKVDFAFPVRYESHDVVGGGTEIIVNLGFSRRDVTDISQLPLLQSMLPQEMGNVPLDEVTYVTESDGPKLNIRFRDPVKIKITQDLGRTSLLVYLPTQFSVKKGEGGGKGAVFGGFVPEPAKTGKKMDPKKIEKLFNQGKSFLRNDQPKKAVQLFSSLLSMPEHKWTKESMELLGLARERNGQVAQAQSVYEAYVKRYPKDKSTDRVKQRLADLSEERLQPKQPLKKSEQTRKSKLVGQSFFFGTLSQYWDYSALSSDNQTLINRSGPDTHLSLLHRQKSKDYDWRNTLVMSERYNFAKDSDGERRGSDGIYVGSLYTKYKNNLQHFSTTIGRHIANIPGVLGKFDGIDIGAQALENVRMNAVFGYPYSAADKQHVQTYKPFKVFNLDISEVFKGWDISPYIATQKTNGLLSRSAYGSDFRYYHDKGELNAFFEYDKVFQEWVSRRIQAKYNVSKNTIITASFTDDKNVDLENSLLEFDNSGNIQDILDTTQLTLADLARLVVDTNASSKDTTFSIKHSFSDTLSMSAEWNRSTRTQVQFDIPPDQDISQIDLALADSFVTILPDVNTESLRLRLVTSASFYPKDSTILYYQNDSSRLYDSNRYTVNYRNRIGAKTRINSSLSYRTRDSKDQFNRLKSILPKIVWEHSRSKTFKWYVEAWVDNRDIENDNGQLTERELNFYGGYSWDF